MTDQPWRQKQMVLIVDDDLASRELLANYLEPEGYAVVLASSGTEAIEEARRSLPDLIVTDILMPGPGGLQTLFVLKNTPETSHIPAIVVSGVNPRILGLMPAAAYLVKPVEKQNFVLTVSKCLEAADLVADSREDAMATVREVEIEKELEKLYQQLEEFSDPTPAEQPNEYEVEEVEAWENLRERIRTLENELAVITGQQS